MQETANKRLRLLSFVPEMGMRAGRLRAEEAEEASRGRAASTLPLQQLSPQAPAPASRRKASWKVGGGKFIFSEGNERREPALTGTVGMLRILRAPRGRPTGTAPVIAPRPHVPERTLSLVETGRLLKGPT